MTAQLSFAPTMPILVFGGPYSNLRATEALRREARQLGIAPAQTICTGDVVAYCGEPEETAQLVRDWGCHVIAGNCEEQLADGAGDCGCGFEEGTACDLLSKGWYPYANSRVSAESRAWMAARPKSLHFNLGGLRFRVVHGGVDVVNRFVFASQTDVLTEELARAQADVVVAGHAGVPFLSRVAGKTWFNPGVIGMPANDGTADVWYGLVTPTPSGIRLSTHRLAYDSRAAAAGMRRWGYADGYAKSLITGIWPSFDVCPAPEKSQSGIRLRAKSMLVQARHVKAA